MMRAINLSFVLTTYNKLEYLRITLPLLIQACQKDEEIVITDGGSKDGTEEYLKGLLNEGKIHQFISEKDKGESDGFNKGMLMAKGKIIKIISDDDVYDFKGISKCKKIMLDNPKIDVLNSNGATLDMTNYNGIWSFTHIYQLFYLTRWRINNHPFAHCGLGLMIRRDSLEKVGLFGVGFTRADAEYTLRITSNKLNFVWYTGINFIRISNEKSNFIVFKEKIEKETEYLNGLYNFDIDKIYGDLNPSLKKVSLFTRGINKFFRGIRRLTNEKYSRDTVNSFEDAVSASSLWLKSNNHFLNRILKK